MAVRFAEGGPLEQFQAGRSLAGVNPLGEMIRGMMGTINQIQGAQLQHKFKVKEIGEEAKAKAAYDPEARAKQEAFAHVETTAKTPEERMQMFQQTGLLPRPQKSLEDITAEAEARGAGYRAGAPRPISSHQADVISGLQSSLASVNEMEQVLRQKPEFLTGLAHPSLRRDIVGTGMRAMADPSTTQFAQIGFRMQDAYRRVVTGAQGGFREIASYIPSALPDPASMNRDQLQGSLQTFKLETQRAIEQSKRILRLQGYSEEYINELYTQLPTFEQLQQSGASTPSAEAVRNRLRAKYGR